MVVLVISDSSRSFSFLLATREGSDFCVAKLPLKVGKEEVSVGLVVENVKFITSGNVDMTLSSPIVFITAIEADHQTMEEGDSLSHLIALRFATTDALGVLAFVGDGGHFGLPSTRVVSFALNIVYHNNKLFGASNKKNLRGTVGFPAANWCFT
jgi:hypothetical protein